MTTIKSEPAPNALRRAVTVHGVRITNPAHCGIPGIPDDVAERALQSLVMSGLAAWNDTSGCYDVEPIEP